MKIFVSFILILLPFIGQSAAVYPATETRQLWPNGVAQACFDTDAFTGTEIAIILGAAGDYAPAGVTVERVIHDPDSPPRGCLLIRRHADPLGACLASVGYRPGGYSYMILSDACIADRRSLVHEWGHVFHLMHAQSMPTRGDWIDTIYFNRLEFAAIGAYRISPTSPWSPLVDPADAAKSIMAYGQTLFSHTGQPVYTVHQGLVAPLGRYGNRAIGQADIAAVRALYAAGAAVGSTVLDDPEPLPSVEAYLDGDWLIIDVIHGNPLGAWSEGDLAHDVTDTLTWHRLRDRDPWRRVGGIWRARLPLIEVEFWAQEGPGLPGRWWHVWLADDSRSAGGWSESVYVRGRQFWVGRVL